MTRRAILVLTALACLTGCQVFSKMFGIKREKPGELRGRKNLTVVEDAGANHYRCTIYYEGDDNESWSFDDGFHCPPEYRDKPYADDDWDPAKIDDKGKTKTRLEASVPDWCDAYNGWGKGKDWTRGSIYHPDVNDGLAFARFAAVAGCDRKHYRRRQAWVAFYMSQWIDHAGMSHGETKVLFSELVQHEDAAEQALEIACRGEGVVPALVCKEAQVPTAERLDALELRGELTDRERIAYLTRCHGAHCAVDAEAVDWRRAGALIMEETNLATVRYLARRNLPLVMKRHAEGPGKRAEVLQAYADWKKNVLQAEPQLIPAAIEVIAATQRGEAAACPDGLEAAVAKRLTGPKIEDLLTQVLFRALALCDRSDPGLAFARADTARTFPSQLGPRSVALAAAGQGAPRLPPEEGRPSNASGVIASLGKPKDGQVLVKLEARTYTEPVERCRETKRVDAIDRDGTLIYRERCRTVGKDRYRHEPTPLLVSQAVASRLAVGQRIVFFTPRPYDREERLNGRVTRGGGEPRAATIYSAGPPKKQPVYWLGFDL